MPRGQKTCPGCGVTTGPRTKVCADCGHTYVIKGKTPVPSPPKPETSASPGSPPYIPASKKPHDDTGEKFPQDDETLTELFDLMMQDADSLAKKLDTFRQVVRKDSGDDLWFKCWRKNFQELDKVLGLTLKIEKQKNGD